jgi:hypothetical protein
MVHQRHDAACVCGMEKQGRMNNSPDKSSQALGSSADTSAPATVEYKYRAEISGIAGCPSHATAAFNGDCYRAVQSNLKHPANFLPIAKIDPHRLKRARAGQLCGLWGLSMYEHAEQLREMILKVEKHSPRFRFLIGDHCARLKLTALHGRRTSASASGHFDFYEYATFNAETVVLDCLPLFQ